MWVGTRVRKTEVRDETNKIVTRPAHLRQYPFLSRYLHRHLPYRLTSSG
jgi:hypothetical protein